METLQKTIKYFKKRLIQLALLALSIVICSVGFYQFWLKPKKDMKFKVFEVCAYDTEDKNLNGQSYSQLVKNITKNPNRYRLCVEEKQFQNHEYYSETLKLIDKQTNEWEWRHDFDGMGSPLIFRYQIINPKSNTPQVKPLWSSRGETLAKVMSVFFGFFFGLILLGLVQKFWKSKVE